MTLGAILFSSVFWKSLRRIRVSSLNAWWEFPSELSGPVLCLQEGVFLITGSFSRLVLNLFKLSISFQFSSDGYVFLETCLFLLSCPICWHIIVHSIFLWSLYFCNINCDFSSLTSSFVYLGSSLFILAVLARVFVNFLLPFKELALGFIDFFLF